MTLKNQKEFDKKLVYIELNGYDRVSLKGVLKMAVHYEWDVETVSRDVDDVLEHNHVGSFKEAMACLKESVADYKVYHRIVLVRDSDTERSWAQFNLTKFELDEFFDDSYREICRVPSKFHKEVLKQKECTK